MSLQRQFIKDRPHLGDLEPAPPDRSAGGWLLTCAISSIFCLVLLALVLRLYEADLRLPLNYLGDAVTFLAKAKAIVQGDWIHHNSRIGMPFGADWTDFPLNVTLDGIWIAGLSLFSKNAALLLNVYWLLAVGAGAGIATYCLLRLGVSHAAAAVIGMIYALQPYTFYRGISHLHLLVHLVPLMATGAIELALGHFSDSGRAGFRQRVRTLPLYLWLGCIAIGLSYTYTAFFSCFVIALAGLLAYVSRFRGRELLACGMLLAVISMAALVDLSPTLLRSSTAGPNPAMDFKSASEAEIYGLKLRFLLTPIPDHPFPPLRYVERRLAAAGFPLDTENDSTRLGSIGSAGFLFLVGFILAAAVGARPVSSERDRLIGVCAALVLGCLLLATVGGGGDFFNTFVAPDIRCYNRIAPFISFFSLIPVALFLAYLERRWKADRRGGFRLRRWGFYLALGLCAGAATYDQAVTSGYLPHQAREQLYRSDGSFVAQVESLMSQDAMIFELPYTDFPVEHLREKLFNNDLGRPYLHSRKCRWSWGALSGSTAAEWNRQAAARPIPEMLHDLAHRGYAGVWVDLYGYNAHNSPEQMLGAELGKPLRSAGGRYLFFDMRPYAASLEASELPGPKLAEHPVQMTFERGFYPEERDGTKAWHWSRKRGRLVLINSLNARRKIKLSMTIQTGYNFPQIIDISGPAINDKVSIALVGNYGRDIVLPPNGQAALNFSCNCKRTGDPRSIYFGVLNVQGKDE